MITPRCRALTTYTPPDFVAQVFSNTIYTCVSSNGLLSEHRDTDLAVWLDRRECVNRTLIIRGITV